MCYEWFICGLAPSQVDVFHSQNNHIIMINWHNIFGMENGIRNDSKWIDCIVIQLLKSTIMKRHETEKGNYIKSSEEKKNTSSKNKKNKKKWSRR